VTTATARRPAFRPLLRSLQTAVNGSRQGLARVWAPLSTNTVVFRAHTQDAPP
jgi:hypothetical protein